MKIARSQLTCLWGIRKKAGQGSTQPNKRYGQRTLSMRLHRPNHSERRNHYELLTYITSNSIRNKMQGFSETVWSRVWYRYHLLSSTYKKFWGMGIMTMFLFRDGLQLDGRVKWQNGIFITQICGPIWRRMDV